LNGASVPRREHGHWGTRHCPDARAAAARRPARAAGRYRAGVPGRRGRWGAHWADAEGMALSGLQRPYVGSAIAEPSSRDVPFLNFDWVLGRLAGTGAAVAKRRDVGADNPRRSRLSTTPALSGDDQRSASNVNSRSQRLCGPNPGLPFINRPLGRFRAGLITCSPLRAQTISAFLLPPRGFWRRRSATIADRGSA
jgi:hypothetical protein